MKDWEDTESREEKEREREERESKHAQMYKFRVGRDGHRMKHRWMQRGLS
jgi:hypothetical protein